MLRPDYVVRGDGTLVELQDFLSPGKEFREWLRLFKDWRVVALFPMFFASNYCKSLCGVSSHDWLTVSLHVPGSDRGRPLRCSHTSVGRSPHRCRLDDRRGNDRSRA